MYLIRTVSFTAYCRETNIYRRVDTTQASSETTHQYIFIILHLTGHLGGILPGLYFLKLISWKRKQFTFRELFSRHSTSRRCPT